MRSRSRCVPVLVSAIIVFAILLVINNQKSTRNGSSNQHHASPSIKSGRNLSQETTLGPEAINIEEVKMPYLKEILNQPIRINEFNFSSCSMKDCFDLSRCNSSDILKVHIVANAPPQIIIDPPLLNITGESNIIHGHILTIIRQSRYFEPNPDKACIFVPEDDTLDRDPLSISFRKISLDLLQPEYRYGMNYLIFNLYSGTWPDYRENDFAGLRLGAAILAKASNSITYHRKAFDISLPLFSYLHPQRVDSDQNLSNNSYLSSNNKDKTYLLSFKGKRYVIGSGSETRNSLYHLNNQKDVVLLTTCRHGKKWREAEDARCLDDENLYDQYDFVELMRESTFCLTPRGRRLGSFRFLEALNHTCIPVVLSDGWVWPFDELVNWPDAAIQLPEEEIFLVPDTLRDINSSKISRMQLKCRQLYHKYLASIEKIVMTTLDLIERRIKNALAESAGIKPAR